MTKQGQAWGCGLPNSPTQGSRNPGTEPSLPPGRAGALWPGGSPGPCVVAAGGRGGRGEGGRRQDRGTSAGRWLTG